VWVDVAEDRRNTLPLKHVSGSDKGKGRDDYFTRYTQGVNRYLQRSGGVARRNAMIHANEVRYPSLKLVYIVASAGEPPSGQKVIDPCRELFPVANIGTSDVKRLKERRFTFQQRQLPGSSLARLKMFSRRG
jgi:hypothetical protein